MISTHASEIRVIFTSDHTALSWLRNLPEVNRIPRSGPRVEVEGNGPVLAKVAATLVEHGITPSDLRTEQPSLEDVFLKITGHSVHE